MFGEDARVRRSALLGVGFLHAAAFVGAFTPLAPSLRIADAAAAPSIEIYGVRGPVKNVSEPAPIFIELASALPDVEAPEVEVEPEPSEAPAGADYLIGWIPDPPKRAARAAEKEAPAEQKTAGYVTFVAGRPEVKLTGLDEGRWSAFRDKGMDLFSGYSGQVVVGLLVKEDGTVGKCEVQAGSGFEDLDQLACDAASSFRYEASAAGEYWAAEELSWGAGGPLPATGPSAG